MRRQASHRTRPVQQVCAALVLPAAALAAGGDPSTPVPQSALHACAVIVADTARLACYDQLSGRTSGDRSAPAAAAAASAPTASAPAAATTAAATTAAAPAAPAASFGNYAVEHPTPPQATSLQARVVGLGQSPAGRMTVSLQGGAVWELEDSHDPLLAAGDIVNIRRAALGSFIMDTPAKRTHRVRRLN
jgi:hypothetical protein